MPVKLICASHTPLMDFCSPGAEVERAVLTNLHIDMDYRTLSAQLPANVEVAFDGWTTRLD